MSLGMKKMAGGLEKRVALVALGIIVATPILLLSYIHEKLDTAPLPIGKPIPLRNLLSLRDSSFSLSSLRNGRAVLMVFSAECPHCIRMLSVFDSIEREYGGKATFAGLSISNRDTTAKLISASSISFRVFLDQNDSAKNALRVTTVPVTFLIDSGLILRNEIFGEVSPKIEEEAVKTLVESK